MMHSRAATPDEVLEACRRFHRLHPETPLVAVPSTYPGVNEEELAAVGVRIVIYANQLLRSAFPAMASAARSILERGRALEAESFCMPIEEVLRLVNGNGEPPEAGT
jgi:phosphoenolpyruvate phosphomutase